MTEANQTQDALLLNTIPNNSEVTKLEDILSEEESDIDNLRKKLQKDNSDSKSNSGSKVLKEQNPKKEDPKAISKQQLYKKKDNIEEMNKVPG